MPRILEGSTNVSAPHPLVSLQKHLWVRTLKQWFSTFLTLGPVNTVPRVVATPNHKISYVATS